MSTARQQDLDRPREALQMRLQGWSQRIEPVNVANEILKAFSGKYIFNAHRQDGDASIHGPFDFPTNLRRRIRIGREDQHHDPAFFNGVNDGFAPLHAGKHVAWSDPAPDSLRLQHGANRIGGDFVFRGVADKDVVGHSFVQLNTGGEDN
jgi:hypothetical protein